MLLHMNGKFTMGKLKSSRQPVFVNRTSTNVIVWPTIFLIRDEHANHLLFHYLNHNEGNHCLLLETYFGRNNRQCLVRTLRIFLMHLIQNVFNAFAILILSSYLGYYRRAIYQTFIKYLGQWIAWWTK